MNVSFCAKTTKKALITLTNECYQVEKAFNSGLWKILDRGMKSLSVSKELIRVGLLSFRKAFTVQSDLQQVGIIKKVFNHLLSVFYGTVSLDYFFF